MFNNTKDLVLIFYDNESCLRQKILNRNVTNSSSGSPWLLETSEVIFWFMKVPTVAEADGVLLSFRNFNVRMVLINEESPKISSDKVAAVISIARRLGVPPPSVFEDFK